MLAYESLFESYKSKRILFLANLICSSVSGPKALKNVSAFCHIQSQRKVTELFRNKIKKCGVIVQKLFSEKNISKEKIRRHVFVVYMLNKLLSKFENKRTNSL